MRAPALAIGLLALTLFGCSGWQSFEPYPATQEMRDGPGLLSGEDGEFSVERPVPGSQREESEESDEEKRRKEEEGRP